MGEVEMLWRKRGNEGQRTRVDSDSPDGATAAAHPAIPEPPTRAEKPRPREGRGVCGSVILGQHHGGAVMPGVQVTPMHPFNLRRAQQPWTKRRLHKRAGVDLVVRRASQMETLDEWNLELALLNAHDGGCAYQLDAGIYRRICSNGLVVADGPFETIRFRHAGLDQENGNRRQSRCSGGSLTRSKFKARGSVARSPRYG